MVKIITEKASSITRGNCRAFSMSAVDLALNPGQVKQKTIKLVFAAFPLSMQHIRSKSKDWLV